MRAIRSSNTTPELKIRKFLFAAGYRYRLHAKDLPGKPDIVFASRRKCVFVQGCFWHQHQGCVDGRLPKSRKEYWVPKLTGNVKRDQSARRRLAQAGWSVFVLWECQANEQKRLLRLIEFLES